MSKPIIEVQGVSKRYLLGNYNATTLREEVFARFGRVFRGKGVKASALEACGLEEPVARRNGEFPANDFWALRDVSFDVQQGEVLGIIGRNGAGKSTLLKILSRITEPTNGEIIMRGRASSLLEVGTGFHPELTGRENVFVNGAVLGMRKAEIEQKFDEIVAFAEVEKFIDTPVKRYSSGMYVRLAFAVAAHLEPEILIIDEVLAVGDTAFQKKCMGKIGEVSKGGKTVLLVSHTLPIISSLCDRVVLLEHGVKIREGLPEEVLAEYIQTPGSSAGEVRWPADDRKVQNYKMRLVSARIICGGVVTTDVEIDKPVSVTFRFETLQDGLNVASSIHLLDKYGVTVLVTGTPSQIVQKGYYEHTCIFPANFLNDTRYNISIFLITDTTRIEVHVPEAISFFVHETSERGEYLGVMIGCVRPILEWKENALRPEEIPI